LDASEGVAEQDQRIGGYAHEAGRAVIIVANKWDRVRELAQADRDPEGGPLKRRQQKALEKDFEGMVRARLSFLDYAPLRFCSATQLWGVDELLPEAQGVAEEFSRRVTTGELNRAVMAAMDRHHPPSHKGRQLKIYYATQVTVQPPTFVVFVNDPELMHWSYQRYLVNELRKHFGFGRVPLRMFVRARPREPRPARGKGARRPGSQKRGQRVRGRSAKAGE